MSGNAEKDQQSLVLHVALADERWPYTFVLTGNEEYVRSRLRGIRGVVSVQPPLDEIPEVGVQHTEVDGASRSVLGRIVLAGK